MPACSVSFGKHGGEGVDRLGYFVVGQIVLPNVGIVSGPLGLDLPALGVGALAGLDRAIHFYRHRQQSEDAGAAQIGLLLAEIGRSQGARTELTS